MAQISLIWVDMCQRVAHISKLQATLKDDRDDIKRPD
jgi:hypothetical protein